MLGPDGGGQEVSISRVEGGSVSMEELRQVTWGQVMEGFVGHEREFEMDGVTWSRVESG